MRRFHRAALAAVAVISFASVGSAADMPVKAPVKAPMAAPVYNWTGFYIGINGGGAWAKESWTDNTVTATTPISISPSGGVFGGQLGYRWQWSQFVLGVEGTWDWAGLSQTVTSGVFTEQLKVKSIWTATGQVGWAGIDRALLYVKGGWAGARTDANLAGFVTASNSQTNNGWTVGVGVDYAIWQNVIVGVEYDHFDLNSGAFTAPVSNGGSPWLVANTSRLTIDQVVGRLSYQFKWP